jgi:uncharacterized membrane protein YdbT with pleckstrin-like domain
MPYPRRLLNDGEEVVLDLRPHWWFFAKHIVTGIALLVVIVLIMSAHPTGFLWTFLEGTWGVVALVWAGWLVLKYLNWNFTHFVVTSNRVISRTGVLAKRGEEIPLERITNINFRQGIWERVIGAGDLDIESAGRDGSSHFEDIWHPDAVQQEIYREIEANARKQASWHIGPGAPAASTAPPAANTAPPAGDIPAQLQQLAELRDKGVITPAEFEAKKTQLLERM